MRPILKYIPHGITTFAVTWLIFNSGHKDWGYVYCTAVSLFWTFIMFGEE